MSRKIAVVLLNLGGPDKPDDVKPFLRNLFRDPAIISAPGPVREALAWFISTVREKEAKENYAKMGGGSPLLGHTRDQADALEKELGRAWPTDTVRVFIAMRYWHPFVDEAVEAVKAFDPDETVLLPLYPQFSTSTTGSSLTGWADAGGPEARTPCCYPTAPEFIRAHADLIIDSWKQAGEPDRVRILFSAHGLPERTIARGDPYQWQVEETVRHVKDRLPDNLETEVCFQSRVGPLKWIGPSTEEAIERACEDGCHIILTPIAFVSEHIETLVELDEEYAELAEHHGARGYTRVPALGLNHNYIATLRELAVSALEGERGIKPPNGARICPGQFGACPCKMMSQSDEMETT